MTIEDFIKNEQVMLEAFKTFWNASPYPDNLAYEEWVEQFEIFANHYLQNSNNSSSL